MKDLYKKLKDGGPIKGKSKKEPIIVNDPNDPRLKAYNDSLELYNSSQGLNSLIQNSGLYNSEQKLKDPVETPTKTGSFNVPSPIYSGKPKKYSEYARSLKGNIRFPLKKGIAPLYYNAYSSIYSPIKTDEEADRLSKNHVPFSYFYYSTPVYKKPEQPVQYSPYSQPLNINSISPVLKTNNMEVQRMNVNPASIPSTNDYQTHLYSAWQNLHNQNRPIGYYEDEGKKVDIDYNTYKKMTGKDPYKFAMGGNLAQRLNAPKMRVGRDAPDGSVWKDIGAGAYGVLEGTLDTVSMGMTDKLTDAGYKGLQKLGGSGNTREQDMIRGFGNTGGAILGAVVNPASTMSAVNQGIKGLGQGVGNINEDTQGIGNAISGLSGLTGLIPSGGGNIGSNVEQSQEMEAAFSGMSLKNGGKLSHITEGGTHEQNALGGVPIGNSLVEQGETIHNGEFVFSDRLKPKGSKRTFAQLSKSINNKFKLRPYDTLSNQAKDMELNNLAIEQESLKEKMAQKYMGKALAIGKTMCYGGKMGSGGYFQGPISQVLDVNNGQFMADGGKLPTYIMEDSGNIPKTRENDIINQGITDYYNKEAIPTSFQGIFNDRVNELGIDRATQEYRKLVEGEQSMAKGGWIQKAINPEHKGYCTPMTKSTCTPHRKALAMRFKHGDLSKKAYGGNIYDDGGNLGTSYIQYDEMGNPITADQLYQPVDKDYLKFSKTGNETPDFSDLTYSSPIPINSDVAEMGNMQSLYPNIDIAKKEGMSENNSFSKVGNLGFISNLAGNAIKAGMVATSKPPIYNPTLNLKLLNSTPAERLAIMEGRKENQMLKDIIRRNATSSGQYLTNAMLAGTEATDRLGKIAAGIRGEYDNKNVGISNEEKVRNQQIVSGNNLAKEQFRDNRLNQYNKILDSVIGGTQQRFVKDENANDYQNQILNIMKTYNFEPQFEDGKIVFKPRR